MCEQYSLSELGVIRGAANKLCSVGHYNHACVIAKKNLEITKKKFGYFHLRTAQCEQDLAVIHFKMDKKGPAILFYKSFLLTARIIFGDEHKKLTEIKNNFRKLADIDDLIPVDLGIKNIDGQKLSRQNKDFESLKLLAGNGDKNAQLRLGLHYFWKAHKVFESNKIENEIPQEISLSQALNDESLFMTVKNSYAINETLINNYLTDANQYFNMAANKGSYVAQCYLAIMYLDGLSIPIDHEKARLLIQRLEQGENDVNDYHLLSIKDDIGRPLGHFIANFGYAFKDKDILKISNNSGWSVAHVLASRGHVFTDQKILGYADEKGVSVAHLLAMRGHSFKAKKILALKTHDNISVEQVTNSIENMFVDPTIIETGQTNRQEIIDIINKWKSTSFYIQSNTIEYVNINVFYKYINPDAPEFKKVSFRLDQLKREGMMLPLNILMENILLFTTFQRMLMVSHDDLVKITKKYLCKIGCATTEIEADKLLPEIKEGYMETLSRKGNKDLIKKCGIDFLKTTHFFEIFQYTFTSDIYFDTYTKKITCLSQKNKIDWYRSYMRRCSDNANDIYDYDYYDGPHDYEYDDREISDEPDYGYLEDIPRDEW